jgi:site-specific DNA-methyltransferase (adenine-specific)
VSHFSNEGDLILVPFAGSGTECVSAVRNGRHFWATEIRAEYVNLAESRLREVQDA